jgi:hypothetical protein
LSAAHDLLTELAAGGTDVQLADDGSIEVRGPLTDVQRAAIKTLKAPLMCALRAERRRASVLAMLDKQSESTRYAWLTDARADPEHVIVALAIRDVGTCELSIPRERYDGFELLKVISDGCSAVASEP